MKKRGFTLIELLAVIVILAIIALIATPLILNVIDEAKKGAFKNTAYGIVSAEELKYAQDILAGTEEEITFTYTNGVESSNPLGKQLEYKGSKPKNGTVKVNSEGQVALAIHDGKYCAEKSYAESAVSISEKTQEECVIEETSEVTYEYYDEAKGVNAPVLVTGMTPIKWNGNDWVNTTETDTQWYDYDNKQWANVRTEDGSYWVWIPRYAYQIANNYHTSTAGTINVKFLIDNTNTTIDDTDIAITPTYSGDSQTNYVSHPSFKFGTDEIPGIWVAKFEPSVANQSDLCYTSASETNCNKTDLTAKIIPNATSWRYITIGNAFDVSLAMKNNAVYGWQANEVDTHMMKNSEWGAVTYLSKSTYGKVDEVWINPANDYTTGCAGDTVSSSATTGCTNEYNTDNGQQASTTGNVYGVYDMSGGAWERTASYVDNGHDSLTTYGTSILSADSKYKDMYVVHVTDVGQYNYEANAGIFGDAVYETSSSGGDFTSWFTDYSNKPFSSTPWFNRGGLYYNGAYAGLFHFYRTGGNVHSGSSFRPVLLPLEQ